jgi:hypothetical protein
MNDLVRRPFHGKSAPLAERVDADLLGVGDALVERGEGSSFIEIWGVDGMSGDAKLVCKCEESNRLTLSVMEEYDLGHVRATVQQSCCNGARCQ